MSPYWSSCSRIRSSLRKFTYRFIIGPEYYTAAAVLEHRRSIDKVLGGFYLDLAGANTGLAWSRTSSGNSWIDHLLQSIASDYSIEVRESGYRGVIGNDEMFYDGPGFNIPVAPVCREVPPEYHTSDDNIQSCSDSKLTEMLDFLMNTIMTAESETLPRLNVQGPVCLSRRRISDIALVAGLGKAEHATRDEDDGWTPFHLSNRT